MTKRTLILREDTQLPWELEVLFQSSNEVEIPSGYSIVTDLSTEKIENFETYLDCAWQEGYAEGLFDGEYSNE